MCLFVRLQPSRWSCRRYWAGSISQAWMPIWRIRYLRRIRGLQRRRHQLHEVRTIVRGRESAYESCKSVLLTTTHFLYFPSPITLQLCWWCLYGTCKHGLYFVFLHGVNRRCLGALGSVANIPLLYRFLQIQDHFTPGVSNSIAGSSCTSFLLGLYGRGLILRRSLTLITACFIWMFHSKFRACRRNGMHTALHPPNYIQKPLLLMMMVFLGAFPSRVLWVCKTREWYKSLKWTSEIQYWPRVERTNKSTPWHIKIATTTTQPTRKGNSCVFIHCKISALRWRLLGSIWSTLWAKTTQCGLTRSKLAIHSYLRFTNQGLGWPRLKQSTEPMDYMRQCPPMAPLLSMALFPPVTLPSSNTPNPLETASMWCSQTVNLLGFLSTHSPICCCLQSEWLALGFLRAYAILSTMTALPTLFRLGQLSQILHVNRALSCNASSSSSLLVCLVPCSH